MRFQSQPRWVPIAKELAGIVLLAAGAVALATLLVGRALDREHGAVVIAADTTSVPLFPVCEAGRMYYFPARQVQRVP